MNESSLKEFIAKTKGDKKRHIYVNRPYPIRLCDWCVPESDFENMGDVPMCKRCQAIKDGMRRPFLVYRMGSKALP